jgi:hypothetical protein
MCVLFVNRTSRHGERHVCYSTGKILTERKEKSRVAANIEANARYFFFCLRRAGDDPIMPFRRFVEAR